MSLTVTAPLASANPAAELSLARLHLMRAGYLLMGVGLALVKWPLLPEAHSLPLYEGVTLCLLTAMSLLAFVGLLRPVRLLPVLLFESGWEDSSGSRWWPSREPSPATSTRPPPASWSTAPWSS